MLVRGEGEGASAGGLAWGWASRSRESQRLGEASFLAPLLALFHSGLPAEKEAGVSPPRSRTRRRRFGGMCAMRWPSGIRNSRRPSATPPAPLRLDPPSAARTRSTRVPDQSSS
jgi:hypothetical protein